MNHCSVTLRLTALGRGDGERRLGTDRYHGCWSIFAWATSSMSKGGGPLMLKAMVKNGAIVPLEPLPPEWREGMELSVEAVDEETMTADETNRWFQELEEMCATGNPDDDSRLDGVPPGDGSAGESPCSARMGAARMTWFLLDTNHLSEAIQSVSQVRDRLQQSCLSGHVFGVCVPVLCELETGIQWTAAPDDYRKRLKHLSRRLRIWPLEPALAPTFGQISVYLRRAERVLSKIDIILAALCRQMDLTLLTTDGDFEALHDIRTENWLGDPANGSS